MGKIEHLELSNEQLAAGLTDSGAEQQLKQEVGFSSVRNKLKDVQDNDALSTLMNIQSHYNRPVASLYAANSSSKSEFISLKKRTRTFIEDAYTGGAPGRSKAIARGQHTLLSSAKTIF